MENEIWKDIKGFVGAYQVSNFGNVRSLDRDVLMHNVKRPYAPRGRDEIWHRKGKVLKHVYQGNGAPYVRLYRPDGSRVSVPVKVLVAEAFIYIPNSYHSTRQIKQRDKDINNCRADNLYV